MEKKTDVIEYGKKEALEGYGSILDDIRSLLEKAQYRANKAIDNLRVQTYWQIGERIGRGELEHKERADYGKRLIERLAKDLNIGRRLLFEIVQFYRAYPIVHTLRAQLNWTHYRTLMRVIEMEKRDLKQRSSSILM